jgi:threonylcarbamoyladenosine tRNA methylthiotransferase MtaB
MEIVEQFRKEMPDFNFTTDVIVGFPGEGEDDFRQTVDLVRAARFSHVHTFRYSRRKGTRADRMENQLEERIKTERSEQIRTLSEENRIQYMRSMTGKAQRILVEKVGTDGMAQGYGEHYLPVKFPSTDHTRNRFERVILNEIDSAEPPTMLARLV